MSAEYNVRGKKTVALSDLYTALLALALGAVCSTAAFVALRCLVQYETVLKIVEVTR